MLGVLSYSASMFHLECQQFTITCQKITLTFEILVDSNFEQYYNISLTWIKKQYVPKWQGQPLGNDLASLA